MSCDYQESEDEVVEEEPEPVVEEPQPNEDDEEELANVGKIELHDKWNEGAFEVNINRCSECIHHYHYSRHSEDEFVN